MDKDGTLIPDIPYNVDPIRIQLEEGVLEGLKQLSNLDYRLIIVSNQSGIAKGYFKEEALDAVRRQLYYLLQDDGKPLISGFYYCPHHPQGVIDSYRKICTCRKPMPGLLFEAAHAQQIDLARSWMIGDILNDIEAGNRAGCKSILINNGNETEWVNGLYRRPYFIASDFWEAVDRIAYHDQSLNTY